MILTQVADELIIAAHGKCSKWPAWGWQTSVLTPEKGFPIRPREESHELTGLKLQQISLRVASPGFLSIATISLSWTVLPPFHTDAFCYFCVKLHQLWRNPFVLHVLHAQNETTPVQTILQWSWEVIHYFYFFIFEVQHWGRGHCVAVRFLKALQHLFHCQGSRMISKSNWIYYMRTIPDECYCICTKDQHHVATPGFPNE